MTAMRRRCMASWKAVPTSKGGYHGGADNAAKPGTPVYAEYGGEVYRSGPITGYGMSVIVKTTAPDGTVFYHLYGHLGPAPIADSGHADRSRKANSGCGSRDHRICSSDGRYQHWTAFASGDHFGQVEPKADWPTRSSLKRYHAQGRSGHVRHQPSGISLRAGRSAAFASTIQTG